MGASSTIRRRSRHAAPAPALALAALVLTAVVVRPDPADGWHKSLTPPVRGPFPEIRPFTATYGFGWANVVEAAEATARLRTDGELLRIDVEGGTRGIVRRMWKLDAFHRAVVYRRSLRPRNFYQFENYAGRTIESNVRFSTDGVWRLRRVTPQAGDPPKWKHAEIEDAFDILGALLLARSLPLDNGDRLRLVVFPGDTAFLAEARVVRREEIQVGGVRRRAIRLDLGLKRIEVKGPNRGKLAPHGKFRSGRVWVSDDEARLPLRAEVKVFVGFVYGELKRLSYD